MMIQVCFSLHSASGVYSRVIWGAPYTELPVPHSQRPFHCSKHRGWGPGTCIHNKTCGWFDIFEVIQELPDPFPEVLGRNLPLLEGKIPEIFFPSKTKADDRNAKLQFFSNFQQIQQMYCHFSTSMLIVFVNEYSIPYLSISNILFQCKFRAQYLFTSKF